MVTTAVVVGAGPGLGMASARAFGRAGYAVGIVARSADRVTSAVKELQDAGVTAYGQAVDAADPALLTRALDALIDDLGGLDVLHHNISVWRAGGVTDTSADDLVTDVAAAAGSLVTAIRAALPALRLRGGAVVVTGGGAADRPVSAALTLGVQKAAQRAVVQAVATELGPAGVHVAMLMVRGTIAAGTDFDPDAIAHQLVAMAEARHASAAEWTSVEDYRPGGR